MIDLDAPVPALPQCCNGHVACILIVTPNGSTWCWGWHLVAWDPEWPALVASPDYFTECVDRATAMLVEHEVNVAMCTWTGRGL